MDKETYQETVRKQKRDKKTSLVCNVCGEDDSAIIEMHHVKGKNNSDETIPLCKNCHAKITEEQNKVSPQKRSQQARSIETQAYQLISIGALLRLVAEWVTNLGHELMNHD